MWLEWVIGVGIEKVGEDIYIYVLFEGLYKIDTGAVVVVVVVV